MDWTKSYTTEFMTGERVDANEANIINTEGEIEEFDDDDYSDASSEIY